MLIHWDFRGYLLQMLVLHLIQKLISEVVYYSISFYIYKHKYISAYKHISTLGCHEFLLMTKNKKMDKHEIVGKTLKDTWAMIIWKADHMSSASAALSKIGKN